MNGIGNSYELKVFSQHGAFGMRFPAAGEDAAEAYARRWARAASLPPHAVVLFLRTDGTEIKIRPAEAS